MVLTPVCEGSLLAPAVPCRVRHITHGVQPSCHRGSWTGAYNCLRCRAGAPRVCLQASLLCPQLASPMALEDPQAVFYAVIAICVVAYVVRWRTDPVSNSASRYRGVYVLSAVRRRWPASLQWAGHLRLSSPFCPPSDISNVVRN